MALFDNVRGRLTQAGQSTVQKAKGLSEVTRLNAKISGLENQINDMYRQIGYAIYCAHHEDPLPECAGAINQITELHKAIEECRAQIKAINDADTCPQCGAKINKSMVFCGVCGCRLVPEQPAVEQSTPWQQQQPMVEQPAVEQPAPWQQPVAEQPAFEQPAPWQQPVIEQPAIAGQQPIAEQPVVWQSNFCGNCGTPCPPGAAFCPSCGKAIN